MDVLVLALIGILMVAISGFLLGERFAEGRRQKDERGLRAIWERRYEIVLSNWASERELLRLAADSERALSRHEIDRLHLKNQMILDQAAHEREGLLTRIQAWTPAAPAPAPAEETPGSHISERSEEELSEQELTKLQQEGFEPTLDGHGFVDQRSGALYEDLDEAREWRKYCKANGLPDSTDPRTHFAQGG